MASTSTSASAPARQPAVSLGRAITTGALAGIVAMAANLLLSSAARGPLGAKDDFVPLTAGPIVLWTMIGAVVGAVGWRLVVTRAAGSRIALARLVPAVVILSLLPDVALLASDSTPGQTTTGVAALMLMHLVTAAIVVAGYRRAMPAS